MRENQFSKDILGPIVRKDTADQIRHARAEGNKELSHELSRQHKERAKKTAESIETQGKDRSIAEWTKKGLVFAHGMPILEGQQLKSEGTGNNLELKGKKNGAAERLSLILDKAPTLSVSTLSGKRYRLGSAYPTGILLADGFIQQGYASDEGTAAIDANTRVSMYKPAQDRVRVQEKVDVEKIEKEMDVFGEELEKTKRPSMYHYNEYVISKPTASCLYIDLDYYNPEKRLAELRQQMGEDRFDRYPKF